MRSVYLVLFTSLLVLTMKGWAVTQGQIDDFHSHPLSP